jgi:hypothetical protein
MRTACVPKPEAVASVSARARFGFLTLSPLGAPVAVERRCAGEATCALIERQAKASAPPSPDGVKDGPLNAL